MRRGAIAALLVLSCAADVIERTFVSCSVVDEMGRRSGAMARLCDLTPIALSVVSDHYVRMGVADAPPPMTVTWFEGRCLPSDYAYDDGTCFAGFAVDWRHVWVAADYSFTRYDVFAHEVLHCFDPKMDHRYHRFLSLARGATSRLIELGFE